MYDCYPSCIPAGEIGDSLKRLYMFLLPPVLRSIPTKQGVQGGRVRACLCGFSE